MMVYIKGAADKLFYTTKWLNLNKPQCSLRNWEKWTKPDTNTL
jgi:hypothetical protein